MKSKYSIPNNIKLLPNTYNELCRKLIMPRTIHDKTDFDNITEVIDFMAGHKLTPDQEDYLATLADLSHAFEEENLPPHEKQEPHIFIKAHLENIQMTITEWGKLIGVDRSLASRLIRGERKLSLEHLQKTAIQLDLPRGIFI